MIFYLTLVVLSSIDSNFDITKISSCEIIFFSHLGVKRWQSWQQSRFHTIGIFTAFFLSSTLQTYADSVNQIGRYWSILTTKYDWILTLRARLSAFVFCALGTWTISELEYLLLTVLSNTFLVHVSVFSYHNAVVVGRVSEFPTILWATHTTNWFSTDFTFLLFTDKVELIWTKRFGYL